MVGIHGDDARVIVNSGVDAAVPLVPVGNTLSNHRCANSGRSRCGRAEERWVTGSSDASERMIDHGSRRAAGAAVYHWCIIIRVPTIAVADSGGGAKRDSGRCIVELGRTVAGIPR